MSCNCNNDDCWKDCDRIESWRKQLMDSVEINSELREKNHDLEVMVATLMYLLGVR